MFIRIDSTFDKQKNKGEIMINQAMKYVIGNGEFIQDVPVIFHPGIPHDAIGVSNVSGAGFCRIQHLDTQIAEVKCYGESVSLKLKSRGYRDEQIICAMLCKASSEHGESVKFVPASDNDAAPSKH